MLVTYPDIYAAQRHTRRLPAGLNPFLSVYSARHFVIVAYQATLESVSAVVRLSLFSES